MPSRGKRLRRDSAVRPRSRLPGRADLGQEQLLGSRMASGVSRMVRMFCFSSITVSLVFRMVLIRFCACLTSMFVMKKVRIVPVLVLLELGRCSGRCYRVVVLSPSFPSGLCASSSSRASSTGTWRTKMVALRSLFTSLSRMKLCSSCGPARRGSFSGWHRGIPARRAENLLRSWG